MLSCRRSTMAMSRSVVRRLTCFLANRIRENQRLTSYSFSSSSSSLRESSSSSSSSSPSPSPLPAADALHMTDSCIRKIKELQASESSGEKMLRLCVETGGCSGFQYVFDLDDKANTDDRVFERDGVKLVVDNISYDFVRGATVDFVEELIRAAFQVTENPSAVGGCSCKSSFMVKQ